MLHRAYLQNFSQKLFFFAGLQTQTCPLLLAVAPVLQTTSLECCSDKPAQNDVCSRLCGRASLHDGVITLLRRIGCRKELAPLCFPEGAAGIGHNMLSGLFQLPY